MGLEMLMYIFKYAEWLGGEYLLLYYARMKGCVLDRWLYIGQTH